MKKKKDNAEQHDSQDKEPGKIPWHPAFVAALQLELEAYKDILEFYPEFPLTTEPLRIDCVIIKKIKDVEIKKNIAAIFRTWNILEYKSPDDYVSINDFYKVYGYACLYTSIKNIQITDLTITFIESRYPRDLLKYLKETRGFTVAEVQKGIYTINGDILPIQIIDSRRLSEEENIWLKNLRDKLDLSQVGQIVSVAKKLDRAAETAAYMFTILKANYNVLQEEVNMYPIPSELVKVLEEKGWVAAWEARGEVIGEAIGKAKAEAEAETEREKLIAELADKDAQIIKLQAELEAYK